MIKIDEKGNQPILFTLPVEKSKHKFEYQELAEELQKVYGRAIWSLFHKVGFTEHKIKKAHEIAVQKGITKLPYLIGIIKRLP